MKVASSVTNPALPFNAAADLRDELARQYRILMKDAPVRLAATTVAYILTSLFLPVPVILICYAINLGGEIMSAVALKDLDPVKNPGRYRACLIWVFILELGFSIVPALMWHIDGPYMKAFAVGLSVTSLMHVSTVRSIHLPMALTGLAAIASAAIISNGLLWINAGDWAALAYTTVCAVAGLGYGAGAILSNNQLHKETARGRSEAQAANAAKGAFLAQMSHELRTPLNAILGMGHAELRRTDDPISAERLSVLISSAQGLSTILDDILDMSAIQGGHLPIRRHAINLRAEITATAALFRPQIEQAGLVLVLDLDADLPDWALMDDQRLRQCLSNLISNALKNTPDGSITLRALRTVARAGTPQLRIEVVDTGPGISPDIAAAIFEPFIRGPGTSLGTGLGLSISRALAQQMGGDLQLEHPKPGEPAGARFILTLALTATFAPAASIPVAANSPKSFAGKKVLVVDDIATNRLVAMTYLRFFGADAIEAASGAAALLRLDAGDVDLVLLDMNMPEMDGMETFRRLRQRPAQRGKVPVIAMTANTLAEVRQQYSGAGIDGYLAKPMTPEATAAEIYRVLTGTDAGAGKPYTEG